MKDSSTRTTTMPGSMMIVYRTKGQADWHYWTAVIGKPATLLARYRHEMAFRDWSVITWPTR